MASVGGRGRVASRRHVFSVFSECSSRSTAGCRTPARALGLAYAALDFAIEKDTDRWVFLESNSSGQYGWLEAKTGAPITDAIADLLTGGDRR